MKPLIKLHLYTWKPANKPAICLYGVTQLLLIKAMRSDVFLPIHSSHHTKKRLNKEIMTWEFKFASIIDLSKQNVTSHIEINAGLACFSVSWKNLSRKISNGVADGATQKTFLQLKVNSA